MMSSDDDPQVEGGAAVGPLGDFLDAAELGRELKVGRSTINRWRDKGLPCYRIGSRVWVRETEVAEFIVTELRDIPDRP